MRTARRSWLIIATAICLVGGARANAQSMSCTTVGAVFLPSRFEGLAELMGDFLVLCTGGVPTAQGAAVPTVDIRILLNTSITSKKLAGSWSEALLMIDEPSPAAQRVCGVAGDVEPNPGVCTITGTGTGLGVYSGAAARPNVFQGFQESSNTMLWTGVPVDPPGASGTRVIRITNVRANVNALGAPGGAPVSIFATASPTPSNLLPITDGGTQSVGFSQRGLAFSVNSFSFLQQCTSQNAALALNPNSAGTPQFNLHFAELFGNAFKKRNVLTTPANPTGLLNQNNLGSGPAVGTETGFYSSSFPALPNRGNLALAGLADQGTRLVARFNNVPPGVMLFSHVTGNVTGGDAIRMVTADLNGNGPYLPAPANAFGIAPIPIVNSSGVAVYEFVEAIANSLATVDIPIYVAYTSNVGINSPGLGTVTVNATYGPLSTVNLASETESVPRFADTSTAANAFAIAPCACAMFATSSAGVDSGGGSGSVDVVASNSCVWTPVSQDSWIGVINPGPRVGSATLGFTFTANNSGGQRVGHIDIGGPLFTVSQAAQCTYSISPPAQSFGTGGGSGSFSVTTNPPLCTWTPTTNSSWILFPPGEQDLRVGSGAVNFVIAANAGVLRTGTITVGGQPFTVNQSGNGVSGLRFVPVAPCRVIDTRLASGPFGGPSIPGNGVRDVAVAASGCGIPDIAFAYSLNVTVVPAGPLSFLTVWPTGQLRPLVSTLNSFDGRIKANAAIVPAGVNGQVSFYATDTTHLVVDINGYFVPAGAGGDLAFYPVTPCRIADTRLAAGPLGGPTMTAAQTRTFPVTSAGCGIPLSARAYSLNMTAVPSGPLAFLTTWAAGQPQPLASTLNAFTGTVTANAAIVPASNGAISVYVTNPTDLVIDINGYFGPPGLPGELRFYPVNPCRISDTRNNPAGPLAGPPMATAQSRDFPVTSSACGLPGSAKAYSLNATVVPFGLLGFLSLWPAGQPQPFVSTLNSFDGTVVSNAAIVPAGLGGSVAAYTTHFTDLILDVNGYFAP